MVKGLFIWLFLSSSSLNECSLTTIFENLYFYHIEEIRNWYFSLSSHNHLMIMINRKKKCVGNRSWQHTKIFRHWNSLKIAQLSSFQLEHFQFLFKFLWLFARYQDQGTFISSFFSRLMFLHLMTWALSNLFLSLLLLPFF